MATTTQEAKLDPTDSVEKNTQNSFGNSSSRAQQDAKSSMTEAISHIKMAATNVKDAAGLLGTETSDEVYAYFEQGKQQLNDFSETAAKTARERPLLVVGGAFLAGWVLSSIVKRM